MKWYAQQCVCTVKVLSLEINPAVSAVAECLKINLWQVMVGFDDFKRAMALQNRHTVSDALCVPTKQSFSKKLPRVR
jgi:hypothetical protein